MSISAPPEKVSEPKKPRSLKLEFSKAADYDRLNAAFDPKRLRRIDPHGYVARRLESHFRQAVENGNAAFLTDNDEGPKEQVKGMLIAYHFPEYIDDLPLKNTHTYTEFGTAMSYIPGYGSAKLIMAALALKEWLQHPPSRKYVNEIENSNTASAKTYRDHLKWEAVDDEQERSTLFDILYRNVTSDSGQGIGRPPPPSKQKDKTFYSLTDHALQIHARILLDYIDAGGINNKQGEFIPVDFTALDEEGLSYARLSAIAAGQTSRQAIMKIGGQSFHTPPPKI